MMSQQDGEPVEAGLITGAVTELEKVAQGGRGFHTSTFDVSMNAGNVDEDMRRQNMGAFDSTSEGGRRGSYSQNFQSSHDGGSKHSSSSSSHTSRTQVIGGQGGSSGSLSSNSGGRQGGSNFITTSIGSQGSSQGGGGNHVDEEYNYDNEIYYDDDYPENGQGSQSQSSHHSYTYKGTIDPNSGFKHYPRTKRDAEIDEALNSALQCKATRCRVLRCIAGPLEGNDGALIALRTRLVAETLEKVKFSLTSKKWEYNFSFASSFHPKMR